MFKFSSSATAHLASIIFSFQVRKLAKLGGTHPANCVARAMGHLLSHKLQKDVNFSGQNVAAKAGKELGFHPETPLGFKHTLFHVVRSELLYLLSPL